MAITKEDIKEMEDVRDFAGKNVLLMVKIKSIEDGVPQFEDGNEDLPITYTNNQINGFKNRVSNRKMKIRDITDLWPRV